MNEDDIFKRNYKPTMSLMKSLHRLDDKALSTTMIIHLLQSP